MSDAYQVRYTPQALDDLKDIYAYIAYTLCAAGTTKRQIDRIRKEIRMLDHMPLRYSVVDWEPWKSQNMHSVSVDRFLVFYLVDMQKVTVTVVRIVFGGRDLESLVQE